MKVESREKHRSILRITGFLIRWYPNVALSKVNKLDRPSAVLFPFTLKDLCMLTSRSKVPFSAIQKLKKIRGQQICRQTLKIEVYLLPLPLNLKEKHLSSAPLGQSYNGVY